MTHPTPETLTSKSNTIAGAVSQSWASFAAHWILVGAIGVAAAEVAARLDDWFFSKTPILSNPVRENELTLAESWGIRGKPDGHYRKWHLNAFGFLGPEITQTPVSPRIMVLGASETFGLYESAGKDYPRQLARLLEKSGVDVVNAAVAGMSLPSIISYWVNWASRFSPNIVLIYPSTHFYLDDVTPSEPAFKPNVTQLPSPGPRLRILDRFIDQVRQIPVLRAVRSRIVVGRALDGKGENYLFTPEQLPRERLDAFIRDLERLCTEIEARNAVPVILTQSFKTSSPPEPSDLADLNYFRIFIPRATPEAIPAFVYAAREATLAMAARRQWRVIDTAAALSGRRDLFADLVHFNDQGSLRMAEVIKEGLDAGITLNGRPR